MFHYRFNITHSNLGGEITLQSHVTETVNNNGTFKSKMLLMKIVPYSMRSPSSRSYASCSLYIIHTKWFVLINEFSEGRHLEMWRNCVVVPDPALSLLLSVSRVETGTTTYRRHISRWKPAGNLMIKTNRLVWTIYRELSSLSCWGRHKLRYTLIWD